MDNKGLILLVDDQPDNINVLIEHLDQQHFDISVALNGKEALELADTLQPDVILLDVMMPDPDGFETCRRLKQSPLSSQIPVLFMSALDETINKVKGFQVGGVDYITKPFQCEEVFARVQAHVTIRKQQQALSAKNTALEQKNKLIVAQSKRMEIMSRTDPLTQLANRRGFFDHVKTQLNQSSSAIANKPYSILLCDIDHFKHVNDRYGHDGGDRVLTQIAPILQQPLRDTDIVARWGGEEFIILLTDTSLDAAIKLAESLCRHIAEQHICYNDHDLRITMSFGVSSLAVAKQIDRCINHADQALYRAKQAGRNRVLFTQLID